MTEILPERGRLVKLPSYHPGNTCYTRLVSRHRKNPVPLANLGLLPRFFCHMASRLGISQAEVAVSVGFSTAWVSRVFGGLAKPTEEDLEALATALRVPVETLRALRVLESTLAEKQMLGIIAAWQYLATSRSSTLVIAGSTMTAGVVHLRDVNLEGTTVLVSLIAPSVLASEETKRFGWPSGYLRSNWLATTATLLVNVLSSRDRDHPAHGRLWVRDRVTLDSEDKIGLLIANDWVAVEAAPIWVQPSKSVRVSFVGDSRWNSFTQPLIDGLRSENGDGELVWDSAWSLTDKRMARLEKRFEEARQAVAFGNLVSGPPQPNGGSCAP